MLTEYVLHITGLFYSSVYLQKCLAKYFVWSLGSTNILNVCSLEFKRLPFCRKKLSKLTSATLPIIVTHVKRNR